MKTPTHFLTRILAQFHPFRCRNPIPSLVLPGLLLLSLGLTPAASHSVVTVGGTGTERAEEVIVDATGNTYLLGSFQSTVDFDPGPETVEKTAASTDLFVASYTADGSLRFVFTIESPSALNEWIEGRAITMDEAGDIYITGRFAGTIDFDPGPDTQTRTSNGFADAFVARYSSTGSLVYVFSFGGAQGDYGNDIAVDAAGNVYVTGEILSVSGEAVDFDPGPGTAEHTPDGIDAFLASYDSNGDFRFVTAFGGPGVVNDAHGTAIALGNAGEVYLAGYFEGTVDFDPGSGTEARSSSGETDAFIARYSSTEGHFQSVFTLGGDENVFVNQLVHTGAGILYAVGSFDGTADFDPGAGTETRSGGGSYLASYEADGALRFANAWDVGSIRLAVDGAGNSFLTGFFNGLVDFDPGPGTEERNSAGDNTFVASYNTNGDFGSLALFEGSPNRGTGIVLDEAGNGYVAGTFNRTVDFDPGEGVEERTSNGFADIYLVSFPQIGESAPDPQPPTEGLYIPFVNRVENPVD